MPDLADPAGPVGQEAKHPFALDIISAAEKQVNDVPQTTHQVEIPIEGGTATIPFEASDGPAQTDGQVSGGDGDGSQLPTSDSVSAETQSTSSSSTASSSPGHHGLTTPSQSKVIGIGVGAAAVVFLVILAIGCWWLSRHRRVLRPSKRRQSLPYIISPPISRSEPNPTIPLVPLRPRADSRGVSFLEPEGEQQHPTRGSESLSMGRHTWRNTAGPSDVGPSRRQGDRTFTPSPESVEGRRLESVQERGRELGGYGGEYDSIPVAYASSSVYSDKDEPKPAGKGVPRSRFNSSRSSSPSSSTS